MSATQNGLNFHSLLKLSKHSGSDRPLIDLGEVKPNAKSTRDRK